MGGGLWGNAELPGSKGCRRLKGRVAKSLRSRILKVLQGGVREWGEEMNTK